MTIIKNVSKRTLSLFLAFVMVFLMLPLSAIEVEAATLKDGTDDGLKIESSNTGNPGKATWNEPKLELECTTAKGCSTGTSQTIIVTFTNVLNSTATLKFESVVFGLNNGQAFYAVDNSDPKTTYDDNVPKTFKLEAGQSLSIKVASTGNNENETSTVTIDGIELIPATGITTTFMPAEHGSYTVDGDNINASTQLSKNSSESYTVTVTV